MTLNLFNTALEYHQSGNLEKAEQIYKQLLTINPDNANVLHLYGILSAQCGRYEDALTLIKKALEIDPHSPTFHNSMGNALWYLKKYDEAISHYEESIKLNPSPATHNNLGNLYVKRDQYGKAVIHYQTAIALKPGYAEAYYNLSIALAKIGKAEEAIHNLKKALQFQPDLAEAHGQLGQLLQQRGQFEEALQHYENRLKLEPKHIETYVNIGGILVKQGDLLKAVDYFHKALELEPDHSEAHFNLGATYLSLHKVNQALKHYLSSLKNHPDADTYYNVGVIYMYKDRHLDAIEYFNSALNIRPVFFEVHANLGVIYLKLENYENAIKHYQEALRLAPDNAEIKFVLDAITEQKNAPSLAPHEFVQNLFDQYAPHFEKHLLQFLNYQAHLIVYQNVIDVLKNKAENLTIVDLGCGTGLCGALFKKHAKTLIGVDISPKMIEMAEKKNIYDQLMTSDIIEALQNLHEIDLVTAADVFGYIGDLSLIFQQSWESLKNEGYFAFTVEKTTIEPFQLQKNTRYAHTKNYVTLLAANTHFDIIKEDEVQLRTQRQTPVMGYLFILQKKLI
jgi:predicted TPR repeat methyltransferase